MEHLRTTSSRYLICVSRTLPNIYDETFDKILIKYSYKSQIQTQILVESFKNKTFYEKILKIKKSNFLHEKVIKTLFESTDQQTLV